MKPASGDHAIAQLRAGRAAEALKLLRNLAPGELQDPRLALALAIAHLRTGDPAAALGEFNKVLARRPGDASAHQGRALALHAMGDRPGALSTFRDITRRDPDAWKAWQSIADITDDETERLAAIHRAAAILTRLCTGPEVPAPLLGRCLESLVHAHEYSKARQLAEDRLTQFATPADGFHRLAGIHYQAGNFQHAFTCEARALGHLAAGDMPPRPAAPAFNPQAALEALHGLTSLLNDWEMRPFPMAGTLLGLVRDGAPLQHDRDVDIGVSRPAAGMPGLADRIRAHPSLILQRDARPGGRYYAVVHEGIAVDLFVHDAAGPSHLVCGVSEHPGDIQWKYSRFGLSEAVIAGTPWQLPEDPERYLQETYGKDWKRPDKGFASAISSPALSGVDPHARAYYAVARARKSLLAGDYGKAIALLAQSPIPVSLPGRSLRTPPPGS
jgi:tetratricopeptide (TPR) repeat protein